MASEVVVGDQDILLENGRKATVVSVETVKSMGFFCPLTESGMLYVDGVLASCYASTLNYNIGPFCLSGHQVGIRTGTRIGITSFCAHCAGY